MKLTKSQMERARNDYRFDQRELCEVCEYLGFEPMGHLEVHHIIGGSQRSKPEANTAANLILVADNAHDWGHDNNPLEFEVACWYAKWKKQQRLLSREICKTPREWEPRTIDKLCFGGGLSGRLSGIIRPKLVDIDVIHRCDELIRALEATT